jgi:predicted ATPase/two-component sensor histidine kinase
MSVTGDYQFIEKVHTDSHFNIFRAVRNSDGLLILIKTVKDRYYLNNYSWLQKEYSITQNINSSEIIKPYSLEKYYNRLAIIFENFEGKTLSQFVKSNFTLEHFLTIAIELVKILQTIHHQEIIHQNIQPSSILIEPKTLKIKVTNFIIATNFGDLLQEFSQQLEVANLAYVSPEQTERTNLAVDYRTDFYSLGIIFYYILTKQLPYNASNSLELMHRHLAQTPVPPHHLQSDIGVKLSAIVMKLIAKNPEERYQNAYGIIADLKICQAQDRAQPFVCGKFDRYGHFAISSRLYGRSNAADILTSSLSRVHFGTTETTLIQGSSGVGKTTFMWQTIRANVRQRDYLIGSKCEQLISNIPYRVLIQAFNNLIEQLLTESLDSLQVWRTKILSALGQNARVMTDLVPNLELIIDRQPNVPELSARETEARFNSVLTKFIRVFASQEHPLILLLDDLQWIDSASLKLLEFWSNNFDSGYLLIVGTYQNDVRGDRLLTSTLDRIRSSTIVNDIILEPLKLDEVNRWLKDTLNCRGQHTLSLAQLLFERTKGNPFFLQQLLQTLYGEKLIAFDFERLMWQWQIEEIQHTAIANCNVVELVIDNLTKLPHTSQKLVQIAACIGEHFDLDMLEIATEQIPAQLIKELKPALQAGIILFDRPQDTHGDCRGDAYKFLNDRLRQTAYAMLDGVDKIYFHLKIGRFLLQQTNPSRIHEQIFDLTKHFNLAKKLFCLSPFAPRLAEFNLIAAQRAKVAIAYEVAADYLNVALELLSPFGWDAYYELKTSIYLEASKIQYLQTNFTRAKKLSNVVIARANTVLTKVKAYEIKIRSHIAQNQMQLAIDEGLHSLELLGISFGDRQLPKRKIDVSTYQEGLQSESIEMSDSVSLAAMEILAIIVPPVYIVKPELFPQIVFKMVDLIQQHGNCRFSAYIDVLYGVWLCIIGDIEAGYKLGKLATTSDRFDNKAIKPKVDFVFNSMIRHWKEPAIVTLKAFVEGIETSIAVGDIEHAGFHAKYYCTYLFLVGESLTSANETLREIESSEGFQQYFQIPCVQIWRQVNLNLQGLAQDKLLSFGNFDESKMLSLWQKNNNATSLFDFYLAKLILYCIFKDDRAVTLGDRGKQYLNAAVSTMCYVTYYFYYSLALLARCSLKSELQSTYLPEVRSYQLQLKKWAVHAPDNYQHKYELVTAEIAKILGDRELAAEHYDRAIIEAEKAGYLHEAALAEELAGEFYLGLNRLKIAKLYLTDACARYQHWGALAKVEDLQLRHPQLLTPNSVNELIYPNINYKDRTFTPYCKASNPSQNLATLDLFSVIKASQAISSEIVLDNLISKMMDIVIENAGAQKSILFLQQGSTLVVAASATVTSKNEINLPYVPIAECKDIPISIINYVQSTRNTVILDRADREGMFSQDCYVVQHQPKSILSCPIIYHGRLQGIIYLENSLVEGAFTSQKAEILQVLLFQVAISIENARLYKNLENHASVQKSLAQKEILLKEIHHRVKNNMLLVSSLLDLQSSYIHNSQVNKLLENCQNRITAMALVHQHLYSNSTLNKINFAQYIESLVDNLAELHDNQERKIDLVLSLEPIEINIETANPCGLIINELVSNALEHGFVDRDEGNIWLSLKVNSLNQNVLTIEDDGVGFKNNLNLYNSDSLGLELVCTLVEQINGKIELDRSKGTKIEITFAELDYHSRI